MKITYMQFFDIWEMRICNSKLLFKMVWVV